MADTDKSLYSLRYNQITSNLEAFGGGSPQWTNITLNNVDPTQVPITRLINTTAPLQGGGNLTADRTLSIPQATSSVDGYLFHTDWTTFNSKLTSILASANIFVGNGSNVAVGVPLSGDASLSNAGALTFNTVNGNVGTFTNVQLTVNAKGLITAASSGTIGNLTDAGTDGIVVTGGVGAVLGTGTSLAQHVADATHNGYLSSTDWTTFNAKQTAGNYITALTGDATASGPGSVAITLATVNGNVGSFTNANITVNAKGLITAASTNPTGNLTDAGTDGIVITGGTGAVMGSGTSIAQHVADTTHNGYLSSTDWNTFNGKQGAGNYITALTGDVTATGPGSVAATLATVNASPGTTTLSTITTNGKGLVTSNSSASTTGSGSVVLATSPVLVTPNLGTPSSVVLTNGTGLPVAGILAVAWTTFTPVVTSQTGTITTSSASCRYQQIGKTVVYSLHVQVTTAGTGGGGLIATLPVTTNDTLTGQIGTGFESAVLGVTLRGIINATTIDLRDYKNAPVITSGGFYSVTGVYEAA